jgi:uncharacterized protein
MFCTKVDVIFTLEKSGFNSLIVASMNGYASTVTKLIEYGLDVNYESHTHWTALLVAIRYMHFPVADILIKHGANVNAHDGEGRTLILDPATTNSLPSILYLISKGANVNAKCIGSGSTPLLAACSEDTLKLLKLFSMLEPTSMM